MPNDSEKDWADKASQKIVEWIDTKQFAPLKTADDCRAETSDAFAVIIRSALPKEVAPSYIDYCQDEDEAERIARWFHVNYQTLTSEAFHALVERISSALTQAKSLQQVNNNGT